VAIQQFEFWIPVICILNANIANTTAVAEYSSMRIEATETRIRSGV
jgi:hypothetical protein